MGILIIDDSIKDRLFLQHLLKKGGFEDVFLAESTREAFDKYLGRTDPISGMQIDLILMDIHMPEMSGIESCRLIKATEHLCDIPIVIVTGEADESNLRLAFAVGALDYIGKPVNEVELQVRARSLLKLKRETDERKHWEKEMLLATRKIKAAKDHLEEVNKKTESARRTAEAANRKITESLQYAKLIQQSLLPNLESVKSHLPESFIIWKPRDIVGGDFFFADFLDDGILTAVIDCTGHGVPGALMTMIVSTGLGRIVRDEGCRNPAEILSQLNRYVKTTLQQDTESARTDDGLDASICLLRLHAREIIFSGARHPLWIIDDEFREIRGDRMGLGYRKSDPGYQFTEHRIALIKKTSCYLFTDGFPDQLGGDRLIPFGRKRLKRILFNNRKKSMKEQRSILISYFNDHKNDSEMTDDVTMVGFQLSETATDPAAVIDAFLKRQGSTPKSSP